MSMQHWWDGSDRGTSKYTEKNPSLCHFVHHKSQIDGPGIKPTPFPVTGFCLTGLVCGTGSLRWE